MSTNEQMTTTKPVTKEAIGERIDKETVREKINAMNKNIAQLYAMSDKLEEGIAESKKLLKTLHEKRMKHQLSAQQHAPGPLVVYHHGQHAVHPQLPLILPHNQNVNTAMQLLMHDMPLLDYMDSNVASGLFNGD